MQRASGSHPWIAIPMAVVAAALTAPLATAASYLGLLTVAALVRGRADALSEATVQFRRFVVLVPAHNEAAVIERALVAMRGLDYPANLFEVHVVADNCTDRTADLVRSMGFEVHERTDPSAPGKGPALNWLLKRLVATRSGFDVVVIIDADTTVDAGYLRSVNAAFDAGAMAVQGFYGVRDPNESTSAGLRFAALTSRHHLRPLGRNAIGGSSGLFGNGMAFCSSLMVDRPWSGHLVEDAEFQIGLLLDGILVRYVPSARLEAEMPASRDAATSQNERWERGRIDLMKSCLPSLIRRSVDSGQPHRIAMVDAAIDQCIPPLSSLIALGCVTTSVAAGACLASGGRLRWVLAVDAASMVVVLAHVGVALRLIHAPAKIYWSLLRAPRMIVWKTVLWLRVLVGSEVVVWERTQRNIKASI